MTGEVRQSAELAQANDLLTFDETEALFAVLIRHPSFDGECDRHEEWDCRRDVYAEVRRIIDARLAAIVAVHSGIHWCMTDDQQPEVYADDPTSPWPCPTLRDLHKPTPSTPEEGTR